MRPIVYQAVEDAVNEQAANFFPEFVPDVRRVRSEPRHLQKFVWRPTERLSCYIAFRALDSEAIDAFVGWSVLGKFPIGSSGPEQVQTDIWDFSSPYIFRWSMDFVPRQGSSFWSFWNPAPELLGDPEAFGRAYGEAFAKELSSSEALSLVVPAVTLAVEEVRDYGIPYLRKRAAYEQSR
jgi:hypothetical protein